MICWSFVHELVVILGDKRAIVGLLEGYSMWWYCGDCVLSVCVDCCFIVVMFLKRKGKYELLS